MLSFNCYQEGYNNGLSDATNGKSKCYIGFPKVKALFSGNCYNTYVKGYDDGYRDGMVKKNNIYR